MAISQALNLQSARVPALFRCPISLELMKDPVTLTTGLTYDRSSIEKWFDDGHRTCPATMQLVKTGELVPNHTLRRLIQDWCVANRSKGVERIPTPKQPVDPEQARQMLKEISDEGSDSRRRARLVRSLRVLAKDSDRNRKCISEAGGFRVLMSLISSIRSGEKSVAEDMECCEDAVGVVAMLPCQDDSLKRSVTSSDVLATLSWIINRRNTESQINVARLVSSLAVDDDTKSRIGSTEGLISGLVKLVKEDSHPRGVKSGLVALLSIVSSRRNWTKAVESNVAPPLIELLPEASRQNTERALGVLEFMAKCAEGRAVLTEHKLCIPVLVKIILTVSDVASERAVGILWTLCQADKSVVQLAAGEGAFTQMVLLIQADNTLQTSQRARELLKQMSVYSRECLQDFAFTMPF